MEQWKLCLRNLEYVVKKSSYFHYSMSGVEIRSFPIHGTLEITEKVSLVSPETLKIQKQWTPAHFY